ncbi:hypothetical protein D3C85_1614050 [compost metagenome]
MLEQVEELSRCEVFCPSALLQPFLIGVRQGAVRASEAEHRCTEDRLLVGLLGQAFDFAGGEQWRQRPAQAQGFRLRGGATAEGFGLGVFALQQQ